LVEFEEAEMELIDDDDTKEGADDEGSEESNVSIEEESDEESSDDEAEDENDEDDEGSDTILKKSLATKSGKKGIRMLVATKVLTGGQGSLGSGGMLLGGRRTFLRIRWIQMLVHEALSTLKRP
jgi:hypothetical protein